MANTEEVSTPLQISAKAMATTLIATISIIGAGAGSVGYLIIEHIFNDSNQGSKRNYIEQYERKFKQHESRVFETCKANRETVELQLDSLQLQIQDLDQWISNIQKDDINLEIKLNEHIKEYNKHVNLGLGRIAEGEINNGKINAKLERHDARIEELYRLFNRLFGEHIRIPNRQRYYEGE